MTDKELLELAAKAAGLISPRYVENTSWGTGISHGTGDEVYRVWNPLNDDGDALRLAVKLGFIVDTHGMYTGVSMPFGGYLADKEPHGSDPYAATRRAIVRAAAVIGKDMA